MKVKLGIFCALAAAVRLLQPAYVPPASCTYAEKKLGCVPNRIPMASTYGPFDLVPDVLVPWRNPYMGELMGSGSASAPRRLSLPFGLRGARSSAALARSLARRAVCFAFVRKPRTPAAIV